MIQVIASIAYDQTKIDELREVLEWVVPLVLAEKGCHKYLPAVDCPMDLSAQEMDSGVFTMVEEWDDEGACGHTSQLLTWMSFARRLKASSPVLL